MRQQPRVLLDLFAIKKRGLSTRTDKHKEASLRLASSFDDGEDWPFGSYSMGTCWVVLFDLLFIARKIHSQNSRQKAKVFYVKRRVTTTQTSPKF